jgi:hypothetical protein
VARVLRPGVLSGRTVAVADAPPEVTGPLAALGAQLVPVGQGERPVHTLLVDAAPAFGEAGAGYGGLRAGLDSAWTAVRTVAAACWIDADEHAAALCAALENLVRTLGTEWARHGVTTVAVLPGDRTAPQAVGELVAWLATPAGAYVTGTALTLDRDL